MKTEKQLQASRKNFLLMYLTGMSSMLKIYANRYVKNEKTRYLLAKTALTIDEVRMYIKQNSPTEEFKV